MANVAALIDQEIAIIPSFTLDCGRVLRDVPVAYKTWGHLNDTKDNVMIICHAFTGSADVQDWRAILLHIFCSTLSHKICLFCRWGPLMGPGKAFDYNRFLIVCLNVMGSPYGSASPITTDPDTGRPYGPEFPSTTIRDDIRLAKRAHCRANLSWYS